MSKLFSLFGLLALVAVLVFVGLTIAVRFAGVDFMAIAPVLTIIVPALGLLGVLAVIGGFVNVFGKNGGMLGILFGAVAIAFAVPNFMMFSKAKDVPVLHDVTTNLAYPPVYVKIPDYRKERGELNISHYETEEDKKAREDFLAEAEKEGHEPKQVDHYWNPINNEEHEKAYGDLGTKLLDVEYDKIFDAALEVVDEMGMELVDFNRDSGRIEATATSAWWGFKDDVVIRVNRFTSPVEVDMRSRSRVGKSDLGANAARIREFMNALDAKV